MISIAFAISKGGQGKTSMAVHAAIAFARQRQRVILVDVDPGAHATRWLLGTRPPERGTADVLYDRRLRPEYLTAVPDRPGLMLAAGSRKLAAPELEDKIKKTRLGGALGKALEGAPFDVAIVDCPPSLDPTVLEALASVDWIVVPIEPGYMALGGVRDLEETLETTRAHTRARVLGYVLFRADERERATRETRTSFASYRPGLLMGAEVRSSAAAKTIAARRLTAWDPGADPRGAEDYEKLIEEMSTRMAAAAPAARKAVAR